MIDKQAAMDCCFKPQVRPNAEIFNALKMAIRSEISALQSIDAVPLDKLCEWLAEQDYEIYCFMCQEAFDAGGGCPNQVSDSQWRCGGKEHWKAFLTKAMEG